MAVRPDGLTGHLGQSGTHRVQVDAFGHRLDFVSLDAELQLFLPRLTLHGHGELGTVLRTDKPRQHGEAPQRVQPLRVFEGFSHGLEGGLLGAIVEHRVRQTVEPAHLAGSGGVALQEGLDTPLAQRDGVAAAQGDLD